MPNEGKDTAWDQGHELAHDENRQRGAVDPSEAGTQQLIKRLLASLSAVQAVGQASADHRPGPPWYRDRRTTTWIRMARAQAHNCPWQYSQSRGDKCPCRADHTYCRVYECPCRA